MGGRAFHFGGVRAACSAARSSTIGRWPSTSAASRGRRSTAPARTIGPLRIDLAHDEKDHQAGRKITAPALVVWGSRSHTGQFYDGNQLAIWREAASDVTGGPLDTGHYLAEEAPQAVLEAFQRFFV